MILDFLPQLLVLVVVGGEFLDKPGVVIRVLVRGFGFFFGFSKGNGAQTGSATGTGFGIFFDKRTAFGTTGWHRELVLSAKIHKMNDKSCHPAYFPGVLASPRVS